MDEIPNKFKEIKGMAMTNLKNLKELNNLSPEER